MKPNNTIACLTGMHRSGTSLMASYFKECGISMGDELAGATKGNLRGHFEDRDFLMLHKSILKHNNCKTFTTKKHYTTTKDQRDIAVDLINRKSINTNIWGWKDPRTSLFLDFWYSINHNIKFVFLYRDPLLVIDSLTRRGTDFQLRFMPWLCATNWLYYNNRILNFYHAHPGNSILININSFNNSPELAIQNLSNFLSHDFNEPYSNVFRKNEIVTSKNTNKNLILSCIELLYRKKLYKLYEELEAHSITNS